MYILYIQTQTFAVQISFKPRKRPLRSFRSPVEQLPKESKLAFLIVVGKLRSWETFYSRRINSVFESKDDYDISHNEREIQIRYYLRGDLMRF